MSQEQYSSDFKAGYNKALDDILRNFQNNYSVETVTEEEKYFLIMHKEAIDIIIQGMRNENANGKYRTIHLDCEHDREEKYFEGCRID